MGWIVSMVKLIFDLIIFMDILFCVCEIIMASLQYIAKKFFKFDVIKRISPGIF